MGIQFSVLSPVWSVPFAHVLRGALYFTALVSIRHHWPGGPILEGLQVVLSIAQPLVWSWTDVVSQYDPPLETGVQLGTHYTFSKGVSGSKSECRLCMILLPLGAT